MSKIKPVHDGIQPAADGGVTKKQNRGFAAMTDKKRQREIASMGGLAAHARGKAHEFTAEEAREAGAKGGAVVSADREHMARIGRLGGKARHQRTE